jgi:N-acetylglucosaminyl-diphospho-decaprenol L-rhamnosyltransferase
MAMPTAPLPRHPARPPLRTAPDATARGDGRDRRRPDRLPGRLDREHRGVGPREARRTGRARRHGEAAGSSPGHGEAGAAPAGRPEASGHPGRQALRPPVSVVIVNWNTKELLLRCVEAVSGVARDIIVVDNASADGSADAVAVRFPEVSLVRLPENRGFAAGANTGLRRAGTDLVLLLNPDCLATPGAVERLAEVMAGAPDCAAVGGRLVDEAGRPQQGFNVRRFPTLATWAADLLLVDQVWRGNPVTRRYEARDLDLDGPEPVDVDQPAAACLLLRRDVVLGLGGFDEGFAPAWFEDVDLCRRLKAAGWRILIASDARFVHRGGEAMRALGLARFSEIWYRNLRRYVRKHHGRAAAAVVAGLVVLGMLLRIGVSAVRLDGPGLRAYARVLWSTLRPAAES